MSPPGSAPAGWYPDPVPSPGQPGRLRWWDGEAWTGHVWNQAGPAPGAAAPGYAPQPWAPPRQPKAPMSGGKVAAIVAAVVAVLVIGAVAVFVIGREVFDSIDDFEREDAAASCAELRTALDDLNAELGDAEAEDLRLRVQLENDALRDHLDRLDAAQFFATELLEWQGDWVELHERRSEYARALATSGERRPERPTLRTHDGPSLGARIEAVVPGCSVPAALLDDFLER